MKFVERMNSLFANKAMNRYIDRWIINVAGINIILGSWIVDVNCKGVMVYLNPDLRGVLEEKQKYFLVAH